MQQDVAVAEDGLSLDDKRNCRQLDASTQQD